MGSGYRDLHAQSRKPSWKSHGGFVSNDIPLSAPHKLSKKETCSNHEDLYIAWPGNMEACTIFHVILGFLNIAV